MLLFNRYDYNPQTDFLGKGGFSRVYKALDKKLNRFVALKVYKNSEISERYSLGSEIQRVINLDHPNISRYLDIDELENENAFGEIEKIQVCVMELLDGGSILTYYNKKKNSDLLIKLLIDVLNGIAYLHQNDIIHRDIKPGNILIKNTKKGPVAKITDFGISKISGTESNTDSSSALIVSIPYMAPEQLNAGKFGIGRQVSFNIDLWSLGITVYEIVAGDTLFKNDPDDSPEQIMLNIISPGIPDKIKLIPEPFRSFVSICLIKDANRRVKDPADLIAVLISDPEKMFLPSQNVIDTIATGSVQQADAEDTQMLYLKDYEEEDAEGTNTSVWEQPVIEIDESDIQILPLKESFIQNGDDDEDTPVHENLLSGSNAEDTQLNRPQNKFGEDLYDETKLLRLEKPLTPMVQSAVANDEARPLDISPVQYVTIEETQSEDKILLFKRYEYYPNKNLIGKGGFSRVYKAFDKKLQRWVALKIYKTGEFSDRYSPIAEIQRVVNLDHSNICRYLDIEEIEKVNPFGEKENIQVCVMELLDSGNLAEYYHNNPDEEIFRKLLMDVFMGLSYLHKNGIIHRDIKPANILIKQSLDGPIAKITDFGISKKNDAINNNSSSALVVSIPYMAPELLNMRKYGINGKISYNLDLWSLGVTIYEVLSGRILFKNNETDNSEQIMTNIMADNLPKKIHDLGQPFAEIVSRCIVKKAQDRAQKVEELISILKEYSNDQVKLNTDDKKHPSLFKRPISKVVSEKSGGDDTGRDSNKSPSTTSKSLFYVLADDVGKDGKERKEKKRYLVLLLFLLLLVAGSLAVFFFGLWSDNKSNLPPSDSSGIKRANIAPAARDTTIPETKNTTSATGFKDTVTKAAVRNKNRISNKESEDRTNQHLKKEDVTDKSDVRSTNVANDTYLLELDARLNCIIQINSEDRQEVKKGGKMKMWLKEGTYKIRAFNAADDTEFYSKTLNVDVTKMGKVGRIQIY